MLKVAHFLSNGKAIVGEAPDLDSLNYLSNCVEMERAMIQDKGRQGFVFFGTPLGDLRFIKEGSSYVVILDSKSPYYKEHTRTWYGIETAPQNIV